jgi:hypothetical protein
MWNVFKVFDDSRCISSLPIGRKFPDVEFVYNPWSPTLSRTHAGSTRSVGFCGMHGQLPGVDSMVVYQSFYEDLSTRLQ